MSHVHPRRLSGPVDPAHQDHDWKDYMDDVIACARCGYRRDDPRARGRCQGQIKPSRT